MRQPRSSTRRVPRFPVGRLALLALLVTPPLSFADAGLSGQPRVSEAMAGPEPVSGLLLIDFYETLLRDRLPEGFRVDVSAHYTESSLTRLAAAPDAQTRRAAVLALGMVGSIGSNATLARTQRDRDPIVRGLGENALWSVWFRADSPTNNATLERVRDLISRQKLEEAITLASRLIERAPGFAEAYNQRAIAEFFLGRFEESAGDCQRVIDRNPFHTGALSGLARCQMQLDLRDDAASTLRRASRLQPYNDELRRTIAILDSGDIP